MNSIIFCGTLFLLIFHSLLLCQLYPQGDNLSLTQNDTLEARQLLQEGKILASNGNYQAALKDVQKALTIYKEHKQWERVIRCEIRLAELSDFMGLPKMKIRHANNAVNQTQQFLPKDHTLVAFSARQKAEALMIEGHYDSANYILNQAVPLFKRDSIWVEWAWCEILKGVNYLNLYQLDSCNIHLQAVNQLLQNKKLPDEDKADIRSTLLNLFGVLYQLQGDVDNAIKNTQEALTIELNGNKLSRTDSLNISNHYTNLGAFYLSKGDYQRASDNFTRAINSYQAAENDPVLLNNIGVSFVRQQKYFEAIKYFKKSLQITKGKPKELKNRIDTFLGLGICHNETSAFDSTLYYCQQAAAIPTDFKKYYVWSLMCQLACKKKQPQQAINFSNNALRAYENDPTAPNQSPLYKARLLRLGGDAYLLGQDHITALKNYQKALVVNHSHFKDSLNFEANPSLIGIYQPDYFLDALRGKAKALATFDDQQEKLNLALSTYQLTIQWIDTLQNSYSSEASHLDWSGEYKKIYEEAIHVAYRLYQTTQEEKYLDAAFTISEKSKNAILLEALKATEGKSYAGVPDSLLQKEKDLNIDIAFYEKSLRKAKEEKDDAKTELYQNYLSKNRLELVALREQLEKDYPKFHELKYGGETTSIAEVQAKLVDGQTAFLEYFLGDSTSFVFIITQQSAEMVALTDPEEMRQAVSVFRRALLDAGAFQQDAKTAFKNYHTLGSYLYETALQPALATLPPGIQRLVIVPDEYLNNVPFEALTKNGEAPADFDFAKLPYLLYDYQVQYAYSADLLLKNQTRAAQLPANAECLAFAPPYKGEQPIAQRGSLRQLRNAGHLEGTAREIQQIARYFSGQFDFGETATERQFKQSANGFGILHLAMHGVADFDNANFNHLIFSDLTTDSTEDNLLHHYEIANMDLRAQLAVLSACETGVGKYEKGEGVYSLARSFMYAGVPSVVMSLWKVSDESTSELMPYFYEYLSEGQTKDASLHEAKKRFLSEANLEFRHPFYWSAFVMLGDAGEIKGGAGGLAWWGLGALLLIGMGWWFWKGRR